MKTTRRRRRRSLTHRRPPPGTAPGAIRIDPSAPRPVLGVVAYGPEGMVERKLDSPEEIGDFLGRWPVTWINVDGLGDEAVLRRIAEIFEFHRLALEDVVNLGQRAKVEPYDEDLFIVLRALNHTDHLGTEQISLFTGENFVVTFQEMEGDSFEPVRGRIRRGKGIFRHRGPDYLTYALIDAVVDYYFPILERYTERLDDLEERVLAAPERELLEEIHGVRKDLMTLRRAVWPLREAMATLARDPTSLIEEGTRIFLRDCHDHVFQVIDILESLRETASGLVDLHLSGVSNRMNEVMKVLTLIATIFIPLSFVAGLYGMNFDPEASPWNMPELGWAYGYPAVLLVMLAMAVALLVYFLRRGWIGPGPKRRPAAPPARDNGATGD